MDASNVNIPSLLVLNNDTLLLVLDHLDFNTLRQVAQTCHRLYQLSLSTFARRFKHLITAQWRIIDEQRVFVNNDYYHGLFTFSAMAKSVKVYGDGYNLLSHFPALEEVAVVFNIYDDYVREQFLHDNVRSWCPQMKRIQVILKKSVNYWNIVCIYDEDIGTVRRLTDKHICILELYSYIIGLCMWGVVFTSKYAHVRILAILSRLFYLLYVYNFIRE